MSKAKLAERFRKYDRHWLWVGLGVIGFDALVAVAGPLLLGLSFWVPLGGEGSIRAIWSLWFAILNIFILAFVIRHGRTTARRFGLTCPNCQPALTGKQRQVTRATGKCGRCGSEAM